LDVADDFLPAARDVDALLRLILRTAVQKFATEVAG
jgi:hypothetical protein